MSDDTDWEGIRRGMESGLHVRVIGWNEQGGYWDVVREAENGSQSATPDIWGIRDLDDGIDAVYSRECDLLISDDVYAAMLAKGDARLPRHPRCRT
jgi:hypothetical protein